MRQGHHDPSDPHERDQFAKVEKKLMGEARELFVEVGPRREAFAKAVAQCQNQAAAESSPLLIEWVRPSVYFFASSSTFADGESADVACAAYRSPCSVRTPTRKLELFNSIYHLKNSISR